jgi:hypothetical protein
MSFVDRYLPYFWQQLISHLLSGPLPFSALFTESSQENQLCSPSPFSSALKAPHPLCCMSFSVSCLLSNFFLKGVGQTVQEIMLVYFSSSYGNTACCLFAHFLVCWMSPKQVWSWCLVAQVPSYFLSITWCGETLYRLGVHGVKTLILPVAFFLPRGSSISAKFLI